MSDGDEMNGIENKSTKTNLSVTNKIKESPLKLHSKDGCEISEKTSATDTPTSESVNRCEGNIIMENGTTEHVEDEDDEVVENELVENVFGDKYNGKTSELPNFAVVYSFLELFGVYLGLPVVTISDLEQSIDSTKELLVSKDDQGILEILHIKLFRKLGKSTRFSPLANSKPDRLVKTILRFSQMLDLSCAWDLEQFGYHILASSERLLILKNLCEIQFDENPKFRNLLQEAYKADLASSLRLSPFGCEQEGLSVWFHEDTELNVRVYAGEEDDSDGSTWKIRAGSIDDLELYISKLKERSEVNPKDIAAEKVKERRRIKQEERECKKKEREEKRLEMEEKQKKGRARRSKKKEVIESEESTEEEDDGCARCYENKQADLVLLCDGCDAAYHTLCLRPPVMFIPEGDWYCPFCQQLKLIETLQLRCQELKTKLRAKERKSKRLDFYGIRAANIMGEANEDNLGRRSGRQAKKIDYNFSEYDQMIADAVSTYKHNRGSDTKENQPRPKRPSRRGPGQRRVRKRFNDLSSSEDYSSGSDYEMSSDDDDRRDLKNFLVDDDYDEIEERHRNKYLRRSSRNRGNKVPYGTRKRYRDDDSSNDNVLSDSDDDNVTRRSRRTNTRARYNESDFDEYTEKNVEDGEEWKNTSDDGEDKAEELDSDSERQSDCLVMPSEERQKKVRKKMTISESDDDDEEDDAEDKIPYDDESEGEMLEDGDDDDDGEMEEDSNNKIIEKPLRSGDAKENIANAQPQTLSILASHLPETKVTNSDNTLNQKDATAALHADQYPTLDVPTASAVASSDQKSSIEVNKSKEEQNSSTNSSLDQHMSCGDSRLKKENSSSSFSLDHKTIQGVQSKIEQTSLSSDSFQPLSNLSHNEIKPFDGEKVFTTTNVSDTESSLHQQTQNQVPVPIHHPKPIHPGTMMRNYVRTDPINRNYSPNISASNLPNESNHQFGSHNNVTPIRPAFNHLGSGDIPPCYEPLNSDASPYFPNKYVTTEYSTQIPHMYATNTFPMRPTPSYPYSAAHLDRPNPPLYHTQHWSERAVPEYSVRHPPPDYKLHQPQAIPSNKFYSYNWPLKGQFEQNLPWERGNLENNMRENEYKKHETKKRSHQKEYRKQSKPYSPSQQLDSPAKNMNFFKNMIITPDRDQSEAVTGFSHFSPSRL